MLQNSLPIWGRGYLSRGILEATSSKVSSGREGKSFAWSRGIGVEISPIKTRSCRKKLSQPVKRLQRLLPIISETNPSTNDIGPLRAMKALARSK
jgi:hypothetical protein